MVAHVHVHVILVHVHVPVSREYHCYLSCHRLYSQGLSLAKHSPEMKNVMTCHQILIAE